MNQLLKLLRVEKAGGERAGYAKKAEFYAELGLPREGSLRPRRKAA
jgi:hypothetical protein